jgi:hypothetical protein
MANGIDADTDVTAECGCLKAAGYEFVGRYFKNLSLQEAQHISSQGLYIVSIYETNPVSYSYFTEAQGTHDAQRALEYAAQLGQPHGSAIYFTVDCDMTAQEASANITAYFQAIRSIVYPTYDVGVYADGSVLSTLTNEGIVEKTWIAGARDWSGSQEFEGANLVQSCDHVICNISCDTNVSNGSAGGWQTS